MLLRCVDDGRDAIVCERCGALERDSLPLRMIARVTIPPRFRKTILHALNKFITTRTQDRTI